MKKYNEQGFTILEVILAIALLLTVTVGTLSANSLATKGTVLSHQRSEAQRLIREEMDAVASVRAANFLNIHTGTYHPVSTPGGWTLVAGTETVGNFTREIVISSVLRALTCVTQVCDIVAAGGVIDEHTFKAKATVHWTENGQAKQTTMETLITYWR
jgi:type II secretory pathway pseudopilin PulG